MSLSLNSTLDLTRLARELNTRNFSRAANSMNRLARNQSFVSTVRTDRAFSNYMRRLHNTLTETRRKRRSNAAWTHRNLVFFGSRSPHATTIRTFINAQRRPANTGRESVAGPNVNMGNAEAVERRALAHRQANADRRTGQRIAAERAARNAEAAEVNRLRRILEAQATRNAAAAKAARNAVAAREVARAARNAAAAEAARLRRAAEEANARARANAVEASRREAAAERAARNAAERAARNAAAAANAATRAHKARTNAAAANAARRAKAAKNAAKNAEKAAKIAAETEKKMKIREKQAKAFEAQTNAVREWSRTFNSYKFAPHSLTKRQIITKMAKNHLNVNIPANAVVSARMMATLHPDRGKNVRTKAIRQVLSSALGEYFHK